MRFVMVHRSTEQTTIVNADQVTYLSHDMYGTKIHFTSGEHIICPEGVEDVCATLSGMKAPEGWLITERP